MADLESLTGESTPDLKDQSKEQKTQEQADLDLETEAKPDVVAHEPPVDEPQTQQRSTDAPQNEGEKLVPLHHVFEIREKYKAAELRNNELQQRLAELEDKVKPQGPTYEEDPDGYIQNLETQLKETNKRIDDAKQEVTTRITDQQVQTGIQRDQQEFMAQHEDFASALDHNRRLMRANLSLQGIPPNDIDNKIYQSERVMAAQLLEQGGSPAQYVYQMAKQTGYQSKAKESAKDQPKEPSPNLAQESENIENIRKGQKASKVTGGGDAVTQPPSNSDGDEFDQAFAETFSYLKK